MGSIVAELLERIESVTKSAKQPRWPKGSARGGQFKPKGGSGGGSGGSGAAANARQALADARAALASTVSQATHPRTDDNGNPVTIELPTRPSGKETWRNPSAMAVFVPDGDAPATLNGVAMRPWKAPTTDAGWDKVEGQMKMPEPPMAQPLDYQGKPKRPGAGVVIAEPDGRVWIVEPTNHFGGYENSFPKGGKEPGIKSLQANAIKEAWEESGLKVQITGILGDYEGDTSIARYYTAVRTGGTPTQVGWETQGVKLVPAGQMGAQLNRQRDKQIAADYQQLTGSITKMATTRAGRVADFVAELIKAAKQSRYPKGHPRGGQFKPKGGSGMGAGGGAAPATAASALAGAKSMLQQFAPAALTGKNPDNSALKAANKKIDAIAGLANAGDVAALAKVKPTEPGKGANPYQKGVWKAWNDGMAYAQAVQQTGAGAGTPPKARIGNGTMSLASLTYAKPKPGGSNPGGVYKDADGALWLVKGTGGNPDMARNEVLAARLYNAAGASAPEMRLVDLGSEYGGGLGVASRMVDGKLSKPNTNALAANLAQEHFAVDAWLANWDAVGLGFDNIVITEKGQAMRIDPGGALLFRAQGQPKGAAFDAKANEWNTLRDPKTNPQAAEIFGKMTAGELAESAAKLSLISDDTITKLVKDYGPGDEFKKASLADTLIARKQAVMAAGQKEYPGLFNSVVAELGGTPIAAKTKPANDDGPVTVKPAQAAPTFAIPPAPAKASGAAIAKPEFTGQAKKWNLYTTTFDSLMAEGKTVAATNYANQIGTAHAGVKSKNHGAFQDYVAAKLGGVAPPATGRAAVKPVTTAPAAMPKTTKPLNSAAYWREKDSQLEQIKGQGPDKIKSFVVAMQNELGDMSVNLSAYESFTDKAAAYAKGAAPSTARAKATASIPSPDYIGTSKNQAKWKGHQAEVAELIAAGNFDQAKAKISQIEQPFKAAGINSPNAKLLNDWASQAMLASAPKSARAKATAAVEAATAAAVAKPKPAAVQPAMPTKPPAASLSSAANPNKTLLAKIDQVESIAASHAAGKLSKDEATMQLAGITFGSNTYGKKAAAYKNDVIAALGGTPPIVPKAATPKGKATLATAQAANVAAAASAAASKTKAPKFNAARLTDEPDFINWQGTGKGLSSKPEVNTANQNEVKAIKSIAATGNLTALKAYQPKSPSKHVASYLQQVIEDVNIQLNPPPRLSSIKVGGGKTMDQSIKALAKAAKPLENPSQVLNKLAIYPVLGKTDAPASAKPPQILKYNAGLTQTTYALASSQNFVKLDKAKQNAVVAYTGSAYHDINSSFRSGSPSKQALLADAGIREAGVTLKPGTVISRKVGMSADMVSQLEKHGTGKVIQEFGISSTSISPQVWSGNVHLRMTAGPGVKGLYAGNMSNNGTGSPISKHPGELEMLLPANQRMLITGVSKGAQSDGYGGGGSLLVDVTLLPNE